jgi:hypothetical protein
VTKLNQAANPAATYFAAKDRRPQGRKGKMRRSNRAGLALFLLAFVVAQVRPAPKWDVVLTAAQKEALAKISPESLRGHLSFLASDLLQGRPTPSLGLDIAAEYIAAQFRRAGLKPGGGPEYLQSVESILVTPDPNSFQCKLNIGTSEITLPGRHFSLMQVERIGIDKCPVVKVPSDASPAADIGGKVLVTEIPESTSLRERGRRRFQLMQKWGRQKPALIVEVARNDGESQFLSGGSRRLKDDMSDRAHVPFAIVNDPAFTAAWDALPAGATNATLSLQLATVERKVKLHNVIGILPGSDPKLSDSCVILSAHYDGTGPQPGADPAQVWNAANDDGSGTVSVIELASAFSSLPERPRRSLVFIAFYGEEGGLFGSRYYARHPVFPPQKTVAMINIEQVGRTDSTDGDQKRRASLTGFDFSEMGEIFRRAGELTGVQVYKDADKSDQYFSGSDNLSLAEIGIPAHTLCVAFEFPDYHGEGDDWPKVDYENMAVTARMIGTATLMLAQSGELPHWDAANGKARGYLEAWEKLHPDIR